MKIRKKISKKLFVVFLSIFLFLATFLTVLAILVGKGSFNLIGGYFLVGGTIIGIIGFFFLNKGSGHKWDGYSQSNNMKNDEYFKKTRIQEKPFEHIVWAVILAAISIAAIGYFLNEFLAR